MTAKSYRHLGEYYGKAMKSVLIDGEEWQPLKPIKASLSGTNITVDFYVPSPPMVIDTNSVWMKTNYGFEYHDDATSAVVSAVSIIDDDTVMVSLSAVPTGTNPRIRYAYTGTAKTWAGWNKEGSARGNIRDSDATSSLYGNALYNWLVHFDHPIPYNPKGKGFDRDSVYGR